MHVLILPPQLILLETPVFVSRLAVGIFLISISSSKPSDPSNFSTGTLYSEIKEDLA
jgi:hypothetical protein